MVSPYFYHTTPIHKLMDIRIVIGLSTHSVDNLWMTASFS